MIVGLHSMKLPQSWGTESYQLGVPAVLPENFSLVPLSLEQADRPSLRFELCRHALVAFVETLDMFRRCSDHLTYTRPASLGLYSHWRVTNPQVVSVRIISSVSARMSVMLLLLWVLQAWFGIHVRSKNNMSIL